MSRLLVLFALGGCSHRPLGDDVVAPAGVPDLAVARDAAAGDAAAGDAAASDLAEPAFQWTVVWRRDAAQLASVWGNGTGDVYVVGDTILHTSDGGAHWTETPIAGDFLKGVWGSGQDAWAVGQYNVVYRTRNAGATWSRQTVPASWGLHLDTIWGSSLEDIYIGADVARILHSTDGGASWAEMFLAPENYWFVSLWGSSRDDVWAATDEHSFRSVDRGATWQMLPVGWGVGAVAGSGPGEVYLLQGDGALLRSTDSGASFATRHPPLEWGEAAWVTAPGEIFAGATKGPQVLHSRDGGLTWTSEDTGVDWFVDRLWGTGDGDLWAVGVGAISHRTWR